MKVKSAEQYKALRKRELAKKQKRNRKGVQGRSRISDFEEAYAAIFGMNTTAYPMDNEKRYQDITGILKEREPEQVPTQERFGNHTHVTVKGSPDA